MGDDYHYGNVGDNSGNSSTEREVNERFVILRREAVTTSRVLLLLLLVVTCVRGGEGGRGLREYTGSFRNYKVHA